MKASKQRLNEAYQELELIEAAVHAAEAFFDCEEIPQEAYKYYQIRLQLNQVLDNLEAVLRNDDRYKLLPF